MALGHGPTVVTNGLVLALDAADTNSFDKNENLLTYSEDFANAIWQKQNGFSITSNTAIAPDGTLTADTASRVNLGAEFLYQGYGAAGTFTLSCWVRTVTGTATFNMFTYNGVDGTLGLVEHTATTTWQRFSTTATVTTSSNWYPCIPTTSNTQFYIWGAQLERGTSVGPYYPTTASAKNRGTTWTDLSGNGNTGTLTNGPTFNSSNSGSIVFDGTNDVVTFPNNTISTTAGITVEVWFKTSSGTKYQDIFDLADAYGIWITTNYPSVGTGKITASFNTTTGIMSANYSVNTWYQVVISGSGTSNTLYLNGVGVSTASQTVATSINLNTARIGNVDGDRAAEYFVGNIASLKLYNRVLTAAEIQQNFNALRGRFGV